MSETRTPETAATGVVALLEEQHRQIEALFDATLAAHGRERRDAFHRLVLLLAMHETAETKVVHPAVRRLDGPAAKAAEARMAEEEGFESTMNRLEKLESNDDRFEPELRALRGRVLEHIAAEEGEEFPLIRSRLGDETRQRLRRRVSHAEAVVAARYPGYSAAARGRDISAGEVLLAPFRFIVDLVGDALREADEDRPHPGSSG